jgi:hypothetical protein
VGAEHQYCELLATISRWWCVGETNQEVNQSEIRQKASHNANRHAQPTSGPVGRPPKSATASLHVDDDDGEVDAEMVVLPL